MMLLLGFIEGGCGLIVYSTLFETNENLHNTEGGELINGGIIYKKSRTDDDIRQSYIQYAYEVGGMDHVILIECENNSWNLSGKGDGGDSIGLCQINHRWHKPPIEFYTDYVVQVDYCLEKRMGGTLFYAPERKNKEGVMCMHYAKERFIFK